MGSLLIVRSVARARPTCSSSPAWPSLPISSSVVCRFPIAVSANRALAYLSGLCGWAIEQEYIAGTNPTSDVKPLHEEERERVLSEEELVDIWLACGDDNYGRIVKLLMLTGSAGRRSAASSGRKSTLASAKLSSRRTGLRTSGLTSSRCPSQPWRYCRMCHASGATSSASALMAS
jgi:hypothetical protein